MHSYHDVAYTLYPIQKWQLRLGNLVSFFPTFFLVEDMACPRHWAWQRTINSAERKIQNFYHILPFT